VGKPDEERGMIVSAFIVLKNNFPASNELKKELPGARQEKYRALQVPARHRVRGRAAAHRDRKLQRFKLRTP